MKYKIGDKVRYNGTDPRDHNSDWIDNWAMEDNLVKDKVYTVKAKLNSGDKSVIKVNEMYVDYRCFEPVEDIKVGDIVVCTYKHNKICPEMFKVEKMSVDEKSTRIFFKTNVEGQHFDWWEQHCFRKATKEDFYKKQIKVSNKDEANIVKELLKGYGMKCMFTITSDEYTEKYNYVTIWNNCYGSTVGDDVFTQIKFDDLFPEYEFRVNNYCHAHGSESFTCTPTKYCVGDKISTHIIAGMRNYEGSMSIFSTPMGVNSFYNEFIGAKIPVTVSGFTDEASYIGIDFATGKDQTIKNNEVNKMELKNINETNIKKAIETVNEDLATKEQIAAAQFYRDYIDEKEYIARQRKALDEKEKEMKETYKKIITLEKKPKK